MLLPRFLTALIGVPLFLGAVYVGGLSFFFLVLGVIWLGAREFYVMAQETGYPCYPWVGQAGAVLLTASIFFNGSSMGASLNHLGTPLVFGAILLMVLCRSIAKGPSDTSISEWCVTLFGVVYVAWTLSHFMLIREIRPDGKILLLMLLGMIWAADTFAYFVGVRWGKRRIAESISPKKSWEGALAGIAGAMAVAFLFQLTVLKTSLTSLEAVLLAACVSIVAVISDLAESLLKRGAGVKDSSALLPGHGGILDRFDSFLLAAPFFYYYWAIAKF